MLRLNIGYLGLNVLAVLSLVSASALRVLVASSYVGGSMSPKFGADGICDCGCAPYGALGAIVPFAGGYGNAGICGNAGIWPAGSNGSIAFDAGGAPG